MKIFLVGLTVTSVLAGGVVALQAQGAGGRSSWSGVFTSAQVDRGHQLFTDNCAKCHGADGRAQTFRGRLLGAQDLTDAKWRADTSTQDIAGVIKHGHEHMPAFDQKLSATEIAALAAYVPTIKPGP